MTQELGEVLVRGLPVRVCEVARDGTIGHIGFDTVMIDVLVAEEPTFFANLPPRFGSSRFDRVLGHALLRMRARGAFGPQGAVSTRDDEFESWVDLDYAEGRAAMRGTRRLRDNGFVLGPVLERLAANSEAQDAAKPNATEAPR